MDRVNTHPLGDLKCDDLTSRQREELDLALSEGAPEDRQEAVLAVLAAQGDPLALRRAMEDWPDVNPALAVVWAAENGRAQALKVALSAFEPQDFHPLATSLALAGGHHDCLELLAGSSAGRGEALIQAAIQGDARACEIFMAAGCDPRERIGGAGSNGGG